MGELSRGQGRGTRQDWLDSKSCSLIRLLARKELTDYCLRLRDVVPPTIGAASQK